MDKKFRIRARAEIYADYEVSAKNEKEARKKFLSGSAQYLGQDTSDDHLTVSERNIVSIEEQ